MARVIVNNRFRELRRAADHQIIAAVNTAAQATAEGAKGVPSQYDIGDIVSQIRAYPAKRSKRGISAVVVSPDFRSWWFERGTYGTTRIKPVLFMRKGLSYGRKMLEFELRRRLS
jgi:hypothetical protein